VKLDVDTLRTLALNVIVMLLSLSVHEFAHAWTAWRLGDDTPRRQGRLTLSPLAHADLFGTLLIPAFSSLLFGYSLIGWAKPVQFVPSNLTRRISMRSGIALVAVAGPLSNVAFAIIALGLFGLLERWIPAAAGLRGALHVLLVSLFVSNIALFVFNMLPVPPLDGSRLLPRSLDQLQERVAPYAFLVVLLALSFAPVRYVLIYTPVMFVVDTLQGLFGIYPLGRSA
jgi:Zn-dependent protease